jgi:Flp pilus assembly protein TadG
MKAAPKRENSTGRPRLFSLTGLRRFARDAAGASALEFALVATPFFLTLFAIVEVGLVYFVSLNLDNATEAAARLIRTGQAQTQGLSAAQFKTQMCNFIWAPIDCGGLRVDVRHYASFGDAAANPTNPLDGTGNLKSNFSYDPGNPNDVVVVRTYYEWTLAAQLPSLISLSNLQDGGRLIQSAAAFRNEPYPTP